MRQREGRQRDFLAVGIGARFGQASEQTQVVAGRNEPDPISRTVLQAEPDEAARSSKSKLVRLDWSTGYPGYRADMTSPASRAVLATAQRAAAGPVAVLPIMGGSVPIHLFTQILDVPVIGLPIANHDNNQHAANENARLQNLWDGIETYAAMLGELDW